MSSRSNYDANRDRDYDADGKHHGKWTASGESRDLNNSTGVSSSSSRLGRGDRYDSDRRRDSDFDRDFDRDYDRDYDRSDRYGSGMRGSRGLSGYNSGYGDSYGSSGYGSSYPSHLGGLGSSSYGSSSYGGFPHHLAGSSYPSNHYNSPYQLGSGLGSSGFGSSYPSHLGGLGSSGYGSSYPSHLGGLGSSSYGSPYHGSYFGDSYSYGSGHPGFGGLSHPGQFGGFSHPGQYGSYDRDYRGSSSRGLGGFGNNNRHPVDVYEVGNDYIIELDLPGHSRDHIETKLAGNELLILSKPPKRDHQFHLNERSLGHREINRKLYLPPNADSQKINAALTNGVLRITIPKNAALAQSTGVVGTTPTAVIIPAVQQQAPHLTTVTTDTVTTTTDTKRI